MDQYSTGAQSAVRAVLPMLVAFKSKAEGHTRQGDVDLRERIPEFEKQEREN